jgi:hypothetical protein
VTLGWNRWYIEQIISRLPPGDLGLPEENELRELRSLAALALLSGFSLQAAERLGELRPGAAVTDLLGGRLTIRLPRGAHIEAMAHSVMSAPAAEAEQTRIVLDAGPQRMVIMTNELFSLASKDIQNKISKNSQRNSSR